MDLSGLDRGAWYSGSGQNLHQTLRNLNGRDSLRGDGIVKSDGAAHDGGVDKILRKRGIFPQYLQNANSDEIDVAEQIAGILVKGASEAHIVIADALPGLHHVSAKAGSAIAGRANARRTRRLTFQTCALVVAREEGVACTAAQAHRLAAAGSAALDARAAHALVYVVPCFADCAVLDVKVVALDAVGQGRAFLAAGAVGLGSQEVARALAASAAGVRQTTSEINFANPVDQSGAILTAQTLMRFVIHAGNARQLTLQHTQPSGVEHVALRAETASAPIAF